MVCLLVSFLLMFCACEPSQSVATRSLLEPEPELESVQHVHQKKNVKRVTHRYSPFIITLEGGGQFERISFKEVGKNLQKKETHLEVYEAIAESLAMELGKEAKLSMNAQVEYDTSILDPANHVSCGAAHLYVDFWQSAPGKWGYSLWSGCGEEDNFAWHEVASSFVAADVVDRVQPLARGIVNSLKVATRKKCYQKTC